MLGRWVKIVAVVACLSMPVGWAATVSARPEALRDDIVYVIAGTWHTEVALPVGEVTGPLRRLTAGFPEAPYLIFGWGARAFSMARNPGLGDLVRAAVPGPAVMLVIPLGLAPTAYLGPTNAWAIPVSRSGAAGLSQFLWADVAKDRNDQPVRAGPGPYPHSVFYASTGTYDASHTCNTWTADALHAAGLPVTAAGVVFAGGLTEQLPSLVAASRRTPR